MRLRCGCDTSCALCPTGQKYRDELDHYENACFDEWDYRAWLTAKRKLASHFVRNSYTKSEVRIIIQYLYMTDAMHPEYNPGKATVLHREHKKLMDRVFSDLRDGKLELDWFLKQEE